MLNPNNDEVYQSFVLRQSIPEIVAKERET